MENWGLVTYREVDLMIDPARASSQQKQRVAVVVTHELGGWIYVVCVCVCFEAVAVYYAAMRVLTSLPFSLCVSLSTLPT